MLLRSLFTAALWVLLCANAPAEDLAVFIDAGDVDGLRDAINNANDATGPGLIFIRPGPNGETEFCFDSPVDGGTSALPAINRLIEIYPLNADGPTITFKTEPGAGNDFRFAQVEGFGAFQLSGFNIEGFGAPDGNGGAILVTGDGRLNFSSGRMSGNSAGGSGGAIAASGNGSVSVRDSEFRDNRCGSVGGAVSIEGNASGGLNRNIFADNDAGVYGCDLNLSSGSSARFGTALYLRENVFGSGCGNVLIENPFGGVMVRNNTFQHPENGIDSTDLVDLFSNLFDIGPPPGKLRAAADQNPGTEAMCNDFGTGAFNSLGHNISADASCALDQGTDLSDTDPMLDGSLMPMAGSPAIDSGPVDISISGGEPLATLPCGYADAMGTGRPQDGDGDGSFVCDRGALEVMGSGDISAGHSAAFYNRDRNGEGNYVEILSDSTAVVYTFTYRPDGSGPAWFIGVGNIAGNSVVIDELLRPIGTRFGDGFDAEEIDFSPAGGMSLVFPNCQAGGRGGSAAYSGEFDIGYEALLSRAERLSQVTGCNFDPDPNVGLSGSWFDPDRNGEGLIVQWLANGQVLAIFFTYDEQGDQFWTFGIGTPVGKTVSIDALYPSSSTSWGSDFDADEVVLDDWGSFDLEWTDCNTMVFDYTSSIGNMGSARRNYTRISQLQGTSCPDF